MTERYNQFAEYNVRDIKGYNEKIEVLNAKKINQETEKLLQKDAANCGNCRRAG